VSVSEPGGELREALENVWREWKEEDPEQLMHFNDYLAPEIESAMRVTIRYLVRHLVPGSYRPAAEMNVLIEEWVKQFSVVLRDKRSAWRDKPV
jgi:hypothetical protein